MYLFICKQIQTLRYTPPTPSSSEPDRVWEASGTSQADQTTSPVPDQMSSLGRVQMVPASSEGKVRVTQWVKLDPSWKLAPAAGPHSSAGIISIRAHAGWMRDYNGVWRSGTHVNVAEGLWGWNVTVEYSDHLSWFVLFLKCFFYCKKLHLL